MIATAPLPSVLLKTFCQKNEGWREYLTRPFSRGQYTYATDGRVAVRIPRNGDVPEFEQAPAVEKIFEKAQTLFEKRPFDPSAFSPAPEASLPPKSYSECETCDERGTKHDCPDCNCKCEDCDGSGQTDDDMHRTLGVDGLPILMDVARRVWALPGLKLGPRPAKAGDTWPFRFDGGEGILVTRREEASEHFDISPMQAKREEQS